MVFTVYSTMMKSFSGNTGGLISTWTQTFAFIWLTASLHNYFMWSTRFPLL